MQFRSDHNKNEVIQNMSKLIRKKNSHARLWITKYKQNQKKQWNLVTKKKQLLQQLRWLLIILCYRKPIVCWVSWRIETIAITKLLLARESVPFSLDSKRLTATTNWFYLSQIPFGFSTLPLPPYHYASLLTCYFAERNS